jgi:undecaprenyl-diphosphatase
MGVAAAILLGILQGLTEFFPVSSSGHLVIAQVFLGVRQEGILMEVLLHLGTALVVFAYYKEKAGYLLAPRLDGERNRYRAAILVGLIPAVVVGLFLRDRIEALFETPYPTLGALAATGLLLLATRYATTKERRLTLTVALVIGIAQAVAILPGISRSGATIATALFLGLPRKEAAQFSFLLSVPAVLGAALLTARDLPGASPDGGFLLPALAGMVAAMVAGYLALRYLIRIVEAGRIDRFGWYCLAAALVATAALVL